MALQNYIGTVLGLCLMEVAATFALYYHFNEAGEPGTVLRATNA